MSDWAASLLKKPTTKKEADESSPPTGFKDASNENDAKDSAESKESEEHSPKEQSPIESYNAAEVLSFLNAQYEAELAAANQDKTGEKYRIYQLLDSSSAWSTKPFTSGKRSQGGGYELLKELNRRLQRRPSRKP